MCWTPGLLQRTRDPAGESTFGALGIFRIQPLEAENLVTWSLEACAAPTSAVPLPAFSPQASALSVAAAEAAPPGWSLQEEECAAAGARGAEAFAAAERVDCGSARVGWVQDDRFRDAYSVVAQTVGHCASLAQPNSARESVSAHSLSPVVMGRFATACTQTGSPAGSNEIEP